MEIPPRMRRRAAFVYAFVDVGGKYLRVCGEEWSTITREDFLEEIPPRMRRRVVSVEKVYGREGNTSAYAEKSGLVLPCGRRCWKYLRVCGEESHRERGRHQSQEIPPRMRRRVHHQQLREWINGKYLRVCGEESPKVPAPVPHLEIPPRMRRREDKRAARQLRLGNTSAYAEKSFPWSAGQSCKRKYLRVCGEEPLSQKSWVRLTEIPPRMRRRVGVVREIGYSPGNTSAYAEKSS